MRPDQSLQDLHQTVILKIASALSAAQLCSAGAPFCDPANLMIVDDLEQALAAVRQARALTEELRRLVDELPYRPTT